MKMLAATTAAVVATSLMATAMINDAQADDVIVDIKCEEMIGSFFAPMVFGATVGIHSSSYGKCGPLVH